MIVSNAIARSADSTVTQTNEPTSLNTTSGVSIATGSETSIGAKGASKKNDIVVSAGAVRNVFESYGKASSDQLSASEIGQISKDRQYLQRTGGNTETVRALQFVEALGTTSSGGFRGVSLSTAQLYFDKGKGVSADTFWNLRDELINDAQRQR